MIDIKNVILSAEEMKKCQEFSIKCAENQQEYEYGQHDTKPRSKKEIARDNLIGKIAEVAFQNIMKQNYDIEAPLDFNYYPRGKYDTQDSIINGWSIDVKGTRQRSKWMLIEWNKLNFRQKENKLSLLYVMFSVGWNRYNDKPTGTACFTGYAPLSQLSKNSKNTLILKKGELIPNTNTHLQADNYGILFSNLFHNLDCLVEHIRNHDPNIQMAQEFCNPYTGKKTSDMHK